MVIAMRPASARQKRAAVLFAQALGGLQHQANDALLGGLRPAHLGRGLGDEPLGQVGVAAQDRRGAGQPGCGGLQYVSSRPRAQLRPIPLRLQPGAPPSLSGH